ncbi:trypsin delta [Amyelois transitella]|uniref:trypsin delta n=1 Tax=Amyelois transitella TaxID=680683 RepID=UPI00299080A0|nr:trypsin delta [Amyelois transitella]
MIGCCNAASINDTRIITTLKYSNFRVKPTVVSGTAVKIYEVPYLVSLKEINKRIDKINYKWSNLCGGSIIGDSRVLTAAHCFEDNNFYYARKFEKLGVAAGSVYTNLVHDGRPHGRVTTDAGQWRKLEQVLIHPEFLFPLNDIAVVYVTSDWSFNVNVQPVSFSKVNLDYPSECYIAGYGRKGHDKSSVTTDVLLTAAIRLFTKLQCTVVWQMNMDTYICTDASLGDVSSGDSGGPLICYGTKEAGDAPLLVGVVSD